MSDFQADVPQHADQLVKLLLQGRIRLVHIQQNQQINVRFGVQLTASVTAHRDQRDLLGHGDLLPDLVQVSVDQPAVRAEQARRFASAGGSLRSSGVPTGLPLAGIGLQKALFEGQTIIA